MKAKTFKIKKIETMRDKRSFQIDFELAEAEWSNYFELPIKDGDTVEDVKTKITNRVKSMIAIKDKENELKDTIVGKNISLNSVEKGG